MAADVAAQLFFTTLTLAAQIFARLCFARRGGLTIETETVALGQIVIAHTGQSGVSFTPSQQQDQTYNYNSHG